MPIFCTVQCACRYLPVLCRRQIGQANRNENHCIFRNAPALYLRNSFSKGMPRPKMACECVYSLHSSLFPCNCIHCIECRILIQPLSFPPLSLSAYNLSTRNRTTVCLVYLYLFKIFSAAIFKSSIIYAGSNTFTLSPKPSSQDSIYSLFIKPISKRSPSAVSL